MDLKTLAAICLWILSTVKMALSVGSHIVSTRAGDGITPRAYAMSLTSIYLDYLGYLLSWYVIDWDVLMLPNYVVGASASSIHLVCFVVRLRRNNRALARHRSDAGPTKED